MALRAFRYLGGSLVACSDMGLGAGPARIDSDELDGHLVTVGDSAIVVLYLPKGERPSEEIHGDDMREALASDAEALANIRAALPEGSTCTDLEAREFPAARGAVLGDEEPF